jgi:hypothetical protein
MSSVLAWLDHDEQQRSHAIELIQLFKDEGTVDEIGIGSIRDTIADALFPGTSVLHTRARYLLFVPWLLKEAARTSRSAEAGAARFRSLEVRLIDALISGGETDGVIGRSARSRLKRMPSTAYWAAMRRFDIRRADFSQDGFFRAVAAARVSTPQEPSVEDLGTVEPGMAFPGLDPDIPPMPPALVDVVTFALTGAEADYLRDRIVASTTGSLLAWLLVHSARNEEAAWIWEHPDVWRAPEALSELVDHGRRFHHSIHGAALIYNLLLGEKKESEERVSHYRQALDEWRADLDRHDVWNGWDRPRFWRGILTRNPRIRLSTRTFVDAWLDGARTSDAPADDRALRDLVAGREFTLKGGRARLHNPSALDAWTGGSGLVRLDYRWTVARQLTNDIFAASGVHP